MSKVILSDLIALGYCRPGSRMFFARHRLSWKRLKAEGVPLAAVEAIDDEMAQAVAAQARKRIAEGDSQ